MTREPEELLLSELAAIYAEADALHDGWTCQATAECCQFGLTGKEPYVTSIEVAALQAALRQLGKRVGRGVDNLGDRSRANARSEGAGGRAGASGRRGGEAQDPAGPCPFLDANLRCTVYAARPLGCRTFFCHRVERGGPKVTHATWREIVRRIEGLAARHRKGGDEGRPLRRALRDVLPPPGR